MISSCGLLGKYFDDRIGDSNAGMVTTATCRIRLRFGLVADGVNPPVYLYTNAEIPPTMENMLEL